MKNQTEQLKEAAGAIALDILLLGDSVSMIEDAFSPLIYKIAYAW